MFNATYFTYDGVYSGEYGLKIASFNDSNTETTAVYAPTVYTSKSAASRRFYFDGFKYEGTPEYTFEILSEVPVSHLARRDILAWLHSRNGFKKLTIHQADYEPYYFNCVFTNIDLMYINGYNVGFRVTAKFDSPYGYGDVVKKSITGSGETQSVKIVNTSDIIDDYIYPIVTFRANEATDENSIRIVNTSIPHSAPFVFDSGVVGQQITIDNELKVITSDVAGDKLSSFNKNWLKIQRGVNVLNIEINGKVEIQCPTYVLIGF